MSHTAPVAPIRAIDNNSDIGKFLAALHEPGSVFEVRAPKCRDRPGATYTYTASGYFNDTAKAAKAIAALDARARCDAIYVTLNPVNPALLARSGNRIKDKATTTTQDKDVERRRWMLIDCHAKRPAGISSTAAELDAAIRRAYVIRDAIRDAMPDAPMPIVGMSGNGAHLLYPVDLPRDDGGLIE
jgi:hypothetical protein